ncbi:MAG TPA: peptidoglycan-binding domain-containing protein [Gemmatimonadales bacterium]|jgi:peptidoglycan hydrolase-like protein with peptidoglycan-binding domain|nr:peptidoglycan-binding domain-containing protein [Gemmatimonadales bacterium]
MTRKLALVVGVLLGSVPAAGLLAQTPAAKPNPSSEMQHATSVKPTQQDSAASKSAAKTHHAAWTKEQITEAQAGLAKAGYFKGEPTGHYGKKTRKAIRAYQKANNLPVNGHLDDELLTKLRTA